MLHHDRTDGGDCAHRILIQDPIAQYPGFISYSKTNPYYPLVSDSTIKAANKSYYLPGGCRDQVREISFLPLAYLTRIQILQCAKTGTNSACGKAQSTCNNNILSPLSGLWDVYYVLDRNPSSYLPDFADWLNNQAPRIGANGTWSVSSPIIYNNFFSTGSCAYRVHPIPRTNASRGDRRLDEDQQAAP